MYERMRSAKEIIEEMKAGFSDMFEGSDGRECLGCRITFKIYKGFTDMPHAMTTNKKTGEWISINAIRALPTGYDMTRALGQDDDAAVAIDLRARSMNSSRFAMSTDCHSPTRITRSSGEVS
ncbi:hypothetical protein [Paraburkholderia youngii]|uniref:hypothetical protein n=1 Tax=Paraburkholderia youngii TaxID=2782701 RepID=UPI003D26022B